MTNKEGGPRLAASSPAGPARARARRSAEQWRRQGAEDPEHCLARSLYFEARDEGREGMEAVGWVVLNRMAHAEFPDAVCEVIKEGGETPPCQFSWWCDGKSDRPQEAEAWRLAQEVAQDLLTDPPDDPTRGALFFHAGGHPSGWHAERGRTARINNHIFYR